MVDSNTTHNNIIKKTENRYFSKEEEKSILGYKARILPNFKFHLRKFDMLFKDENLETFFQIYNKYLNLENRPTIPKIIHQIWIGPKKCPDKWIDTWRKKFIEKYPEWQYKLWGDKDIENLSMFNSIEYRFARGWDQKADIARLEILYQYGGVYIDADSIWMETKPLEPLLEESKDTLFFVGQEPLHEYPVNSVIGASPYHPSILLLINALKQNFPNATNFVAFVITGPLLLYALINNKVPLTIFPYYYFYPIHWASTQSITELSEAQKEEYKNSYMFQFGYCTNNLEKSI